MKLRDGFITYHTGGEQIMVAAGGAAGVFHGMVRSNATAAFMIDALKTQITREELIAKVLDAFEDAPRDRVAGDVDRVLDNLRKIGALDE